MSDTSVEQSTNDQSAKTNYIIEGHTYSDRERLVMLNESLRPIRDALLDRAAERFGLGADGRVRALDVGCGEGLYLFDLVQAARYPHFVGWGFDTDVEAIQTAQTYSEINHYADLHFAVHDATKPFAAIPGLFGADGGVIFDLVMESHVLMHLRDHKRTVAEMAAALRPGGVIAILDSPTLPGAWAFPHPAFAPLMDTALGLMNKGAGGVSVADQHEQLLREAGFVDIESQTHTQIVGGPTPAGKLMLDMTITGLQNTRPALVERFGIFPATTFDTWVRQLWTETTPAMVGSATLRATLARKPL